jgi:large subunit ribosomal protein L15
MDHLNAFKGKVVDNMSLFEAGLVATPFHTVKVIARGELTEKVTLNVQGASKSVQEAIAKAGGTFNKTATPLPKSTKEAETADKA